jgi:hypothetical protein
MRLIFLPVHPNDTLMEKETRKRKLDPELLKRLRSGNETAVLKALGELRSSGHLEYIPHLLDIMSLSESENVHREMVSFLADIKVKAVTQYLIDGLKNPALQGVRSEIASVCWQSGMDYSEHIDLFIDIFLESDYMTSLESFSVIEQSLEYLTEEECAQKRDLVLEGLERVSDEKKPLAKELLHMLKS